MANRSQDSARSKADVRSSKALTYLLRHGAVSEGLTIRADGFIKVDEILKHPKLRGVTFLKLEQIVAADQKGRFKLSLDPTTDASSSTSSGWWIRANQGHSLNSIEVEMTPVTDAAQCPIVVHGTNLRAWEQIKVTGLHRMSRNHIHFAQGLPGATNVISGMRKAANILIYVDTIKALQAGIKFFISENGVVLCPGNEEGYLPTQFFRRVETAFNHLPIPGYEDDKEKPGSQQLEVWNKTVDQHHVRLGLSIPPKEEDAITNVLRESG